MSIAAVVDCSALFDSLVLSRSTRLNEVIGEGDLHAPALIDYEFLAALRRHVASGHVGSSAATDKLESFSQFEIERHSIEMLRPRIWMLRHELTAYDASYVALAEALAIPLLTSDLRLGRSASRYCDVMTP